MLYFLRHCERLWTVLSLTALTLALIGPVAAVVLQSHQGDWLIASLVWLAQVLGCRCWPWVSWSAPSSHRPAARLDALGVGPDRGPGLSVCLPLPFYAATLALSERNEMIAKDHVKIRIATGLRYDSWSDDEESGTAQ